MTSCAAMRSPFSFHCLLQGVHTGPDTDRDSVSAADMEIFRKALLLPLANEPNETAGRWPSMKLDFCRWVFGYPRLPRVARLKVVRSGRQACTLTKTAKSDNVGFALIKE